MTRDKQDEFCRKCGGVLLRTPVPAEKAMILCYDGWGGSTCQLGNRFNDVTGHRQFGVRVRCINERWYNNCTKYIDNESLHDCDIPEVLENFKK